MFNTDQREVTRTEIPVPLKQSFGRIRRGETRIEILARRKFLGNSEPLSIRNFSVLLRGDEHV